MTPSSSAGWASDVVGTSTRAGRPEAAPEGDGRPSRWRSTYQLVASVVLALVVLAVVGAVTGPRWDPHPLAEDIEVETSSTAIGDAPELGTYDVRTVVVTVALDGAEVEAQLSIPVGAPEPAPAVLFVHGAGTGRFDTAFLAPARTLASHGIVTMVPNKRLDTYSTQHRDYVQMAGDYLHSFDVLRARPEVDPDRVSVYAESEGGWIAPVMAVEQPAIEGVVLVSAPVVQPRQQAAFAVDAYLRNTGVPRTVFRAIPRAVGMSMPGGGFEYADFDVQPWQERMTQPVLVVYGTGDSSMPIVQGALQVEDDLARAGNDDVTVRYYQDANHGIRVDGEVLPEFLRDVSQWVAGLPATADAPPKVAGAQPTQTYAAGPLPQPRWLRDGDVLVALALGSFGVVAASGLAVGATRLADLARRRRDRDRPEGHRFGEGVAVRLSELATATTATVAAFVWYLYAVAQLALNYERDAWVVHGGWLLVRGLGIVAVVFVVLLAHRLHALRGAGQPVAPGVVRSVALWGVVVGCVALLVLLAYWGVFQLDI